MRNLVLSAFPRSMRLPDPFTPNLKVDLLPEISLQPRVLSNYLGGLQTTGLRGDIDAYIKNRQLTMLPIITSRLMLSPEEVEMAGGAYNITLINAVVLYVGIKAIEEAPENPVHYAPAQEIFQFLMGLTSEGRYHVLNAIANQLRYPNSHTHYFSCLLLYIFSEAKQDIVQVFTLDATSPPPPPYINIYIRQLLSSKIFLCFFRNIINAYWAKVCWICIPGYLYTCTPDTYIHVPRILIYMYPDTYTPEF